MTDPAAPKKSGAMKWVLIGCGIFAALGIICCVAGGGLTWWAVGKFKPYLEEGQKLLANNPVVLEKIGNVRQSQFNQALSELKDDGGGKIVMDLVGDKGRGSLMMIFVKRGERMVITEATLTMSDGTKHELRGTDETR